MDVRCQGPEPALEDSPESQPNVFCAWQGYKIELSQKEALRKFHVFDRVTSTEGTWTIWSETRKVDRTEKAIVEGRPCNGPHRVIYVSGCKWETNVEHTLLFNTCGTVML